MVNTSKQAEQISEALQRGDLLLTVDYTWFDARFRSLLDRLVSLECSLATIEQSVSANDLPITQTATREYYSVPEFAAQVGRGEYTVREWCRLARINAEKCDSGRGEAKSWKIPAEELQRYRDHGLLPMRYLR